MSMLSEWLKRAFTLPQNKNSLKDVLNNATVEELVAAMPETTRRELRERLLAYADAAIAQAGTSTISARRSFAALLNKWLRLPKETEIG